MTFEEKILRLAARFQFSVTSWIRSPSHNAQVGGVKDSRHLVGLAVDVVLDQLSDREQFAKECVAFDLIVINEADHIHVQAKRYL